jgi:cobalt-zinc-cadmium efflux system protein
VLLQVAPSEIDVPVVRSRLAALGGVAEVHDLHVWTLTSGLRVATGHLGLADGADAGVVLAQARAVLADEVGIEHVTLQVEPAGFAHEGMVV